MISEKEALKIVGKKYWDSFCKFTAADTPKVSLNGERQYNPERVSLFCRLRGIPIRAPNQGTPFIALSRRSKTGPKKKNGRPQKTIRWDITEDEENSAIADEDE